MKVESNFFSKCSQVQVTTDSANRSGRIDSGIVSDEIEANLQNFRATNSQSPVEADNKNSEEIPNELNEPMTGNGRKRGVISDQIEPKRNNKTFEIVFYEKDGETQALIKRAIAANDFLNNLMDDDRLGLVVQAMKPMEFDANSMIIKEGEDGSHFYVSANGEFQVVKGSEVKTTFKEGVVFGELGKPTMTEIKKCVILYVANTIETHIE